jgi:cyclase
MVRRIVIGLGLLVLAGGAFAGNQLYRFLRSETIKIDERFYVVQGGGGNTAVLIGNDGVLVVDTKFARPGRQLAATVAALTDKPVKVIINTHYHFDHTRGNVNYAPGTDVIAQRHTRARLLALDKDFWEVEPAWSLLPSDLVDDEKDLQFGDETVRIVHPGRGHTDGDVVVYFTKRRVLHAGDLFLHAMYPFIDRRDGGSVREWVTALDKVLALGDVQQYIPGHGPLSTRADVVRFQSYLRNLWSQVEAQVAQGKSLAEVRSAVDLHDYDDFRSILFLTSQRRNIQWTYEEATSKQH